jgi:hypothetical protein
MNTFTAMTLIYILQERAGANARVAQSMETGGWVFMVGAWVFILTLVYYTFSKVLRGGKK